MKAPSIEALGLLTDVLGEILSVCEKLKMANQNIDINDADVIRAYVLVLTENRIDAEILGAAKGDIYAGEYFPKPGDMAIKARPHRERIEASRNPMAGWIDAMDPRGGLTVAPPDRVYNGILVDHGRGNGVAFEALPDPNRYAALPESPKALPVPPLALSPRNLTPDQAEAILARDRAWREANHGRAE